MAFKVNVTKKDSRVFIVSAIGSLDSGTYQALEKELESVLVPSTKAIIFDMKGVDYISSMGWHILFKVKVDIEKNAGTIVLTNFQPQIKKIFDIIRVLPEHFFSNMEEADKYINEFLEKMQDK
ncbi:MAG: STAS domain-containing protein [Candidatus Omnitrophica bacterium]|nr:STAS domain-containing protein [Candidatus Omnitrophota bacterium]